MTCLIAVHYGLSEQHLGTARAEGGQCCPGRWRGTGWVCATPPRELEFLPGRCGPGARLTPCSVCRGCPGNGVAQRGGEEAGAGLLLTHPQPGEGRNRGEHLAARNNDAKSKELPKSSFEIHPQLGRRNGDGDGGGAKEKPPPYRRLALQPRYPSATRAVPRGLVLPQPLRHVPAVPGVRPSIRPPAEPVQALPASVEAKEVPVGTVTAGVPAHPGVLGTWGHGGPC